MGWAIPNLMLQVKTKEANIPWDPKPEDQKVDGKLFKDGVDQLERDVLRFLELTPDHQCQRQRSPQTWLFRWPQSVPRES